MIQWKYRAVIIPSDAIEETLNAFGSQGWELVVFDSDGGGTISAIFKKPNFNYVIEYQGKPCDCLGAEDVRDVIADELDAWGMDR